MIRTPARTRSAPSRPAARRSDWTLLRGFLVLVRLFAASVFALPDGRPRRTAIRFLKALLPKLEQALRCLLVLMRRAPAGLSPAAFLSRFAEGPRTRRRKPRRARFSLTLQYFSWMPKAVQVPRAASRARAIRSPQAAPAATAAPADHLQQRFDALSAILANPEPHAARIAAALYALGYCSRRLATLVPSAELFQVFNLLSPPLALARPGTIRLDTS